MANELIGGAAEVDVSPAESMFLFGYPHVERYSTGVHDPLLASALYLSDGATRVLLIGVDIIFITKPIAEHVRARIEKQTGIPAGNIMVTATHTHSGPMVADYLSNSADPIVPKTDPRYVRRLEDGIVEAATRAVASAEPAQIGLAVADATGVGTNRHDPKGPADLRVPVLMVRSVDGSRNLAVMLVCNMHPTVLHEDSTVISGDFPGLARRYLQQPNVLGEGCVVVYHTGPSGNQSPRHVTKGNTLAETDRLGQILGKAVEKILPGMKYQSSALLNVEQQFLQMPLRQFPSVADAKKKVDEIADRLEMLRRKGAPRTEVRTAECDWFGAEETLTLSRAAADGRLSEVAKTTMPAEIQIMRIGPWTFVAWPGEVFIEFALEVVRDRPDTFIITLANGDFQGYLVTQEAIDKNVYEAGNACFRSPESPERLAKATVEMLARR